MRKTTRKTFRDYPELYFKVLENFSINGEDLVLEGTYAEAVYSRHDLHRFFKALAAAAAEDPEAARFSNITRDITLIVEPPHAARESPAKLYVRMNPLAKMMMKHSPTKVPPS